jgi:hypothetical protein
MTEIQPNRDLAESSNAFCFQNIRISGPARPPERETAGATIARAAWLRLSTCHWLKFRTDQISFWC